MLGGGHFVLVSTQSAPGAQTSCPVYTALFSLTTGVLDCSDTFSYSRYFKRPLYSSTYQRIPCIVVMILPTLILISQIVYMQLPNFLLALPVLCLSCAGCWTYFSQDWPRALSLGISQAAPRQLQTAVQRWPAKSAANKKHGLASAKHGFGDDRVAPYVYQLALMTACACFVMNVQVATRWVVQLRLVMSCLHAHK